MIFKVDDWYCPIWLSGHMKYCRERKREWLTGTIACSLDLLINSMLRGVYWNKYNSNANLFPLVVKSWRQKMIVQLLSYRLNSDIYMI